MQQREPIYEALTTKILKDPGFLVRLSKALSESSTKPLVNDSIDLNPDWGA